MKSTQSMFPAAAIVLIVLALTAFPAATAQSQGMAPAPQNSGVCGGQPLCFESNDFVATITDFRTSVAQNGWGTKLIDMLVHFQNKTSQPLSLAYADGSGYALDDRGNRYGLNTNGGGVRGMGVVAGNNMDPQFTLTPGGAGDARFEYGWNPGSAIVGMTFEVGLDIREINRVEGNQYMLGSDTLMHYTGLVNGAGTAPGSSMAGATPGQTPTSTQGQPCVPAGSTSGSATNSVQQGASSLASTIANARSMIANPQGAGAAASSLPGSVPCASGASGLVNGVQSVVPAATGGYGNPAAYGTNGVYTNPGAYSAPGTYATPGAYGNTGTYSAPAGYGNAAAPAQPGATGAVSSQPVAAPRAIGQPVSATKVAVPVRPVAAPATPTPAAPAARTPAVPVAKASAVAPVKPAVQVTKATAKPAAKPVAKTPPPK